jgi:hypothetical protein
VGPVSRGRKKKASGRLARRRHPAAEEDRLAAELALRQQQDPACSALPQSA